MDEGTKDNPKELQGVTVSPDKRKTRVYNRANTSNAEFMDRLRRNDRRFIQNKDGSVSTHLLGQVDNSVFPRIQEENGELLDTRGMDWRKAYKRARKTGDVVDFDSPEDAEYFSEHYKEMYPDYFKRFNDDYPKETDSFWDGMNNEKGTSEEGGQ